MSKYTAIERTLVKSIVASLSIKRIPESEIMKEVFDQTNKSLSRSGLYRIKQSIKNESMKWFMTIALNADEYNYLYKERIDEIIWYQRKHHELIDKFSDNPHVIQSSLQELHRLNVTLSNYLDVAPELSKRYRSNVVNAENYQQIRELENLREEVSQLRAREKEKERDREKDRDSNQIVSVTNNEKEKSPLREIPQESTDEKEEEKQELICYCGDGEIMNHFECPKCGHIWCPEDKSLEQNSCPKCS